MSAEDGNPSTSESLPVEAASVHGAFVEVEAGSGGAFEAVALNFSREMSRLVDISDPLDSHHFMSARHPASRPRRVQAHLAVAAPMPGSYLAALEREEQERRRVAESREEMPLENDAEGGVEEIGSQEASPAEGGAEEGEGEEEEVEEIEEEEDFDGLDYFRGQTEFRLMEALGVGPFASFTTTSNPPGLNRRNHQKASLVPDPNHLPWKDRVSLFEERERLYDKMMVHYEFLRQDQRFMEVGDEKQLKFSRLNDKVAKELIARDAKRNLDSHDLLEHLKTTDASKEGVYGGGLQVSEAELDLAHFLLSKECKLKLSGKDVFELGCGSGLLGMLACKKRCGRLAVQDYNASVLKCFTYNNFLINDINADLVEFLDGDWVDLVKTMRPRQFDLVVTAETIYNEKNYERLHDLLFKTVKDNGYIYLAAKADYGEEGGGVTSFLDYVRKEGKFRADVKWTSPTAESRKIVELRKAPSHKLTTSMKHSQRKNRTRMIRGRTKAPRKIESAPSAASKAK